MSALLSFLGGSAFRAIWGEVSAWFTKRQDAKLELARLKVQAEMDAANHARQMESIKLQHTLGVETIRVKADATLDELDAQIFRDAQARAAVPTGIAWVDAWNGCIRPAFGTVALVVVIKAAHVAGWNLSAMASVGLAEVVFSIIGFYFADRTLRKVGK